jgi:hypothetical protein
MEHFHEWILREELCTQSGEKAATLRLHFRHIELPCQDIRPLLVLGKAASLALTALRAQSRANLRPVHLGWSRDEY